MSFECTRCGACCVAPDIAALDKPLGVRCRHLTADNLCAIYEQRPEICRAYRADELCDRIQAPTVEERAARYLEHFQLSDEAARAAVAAGADGLIVEVHPTPKLPSRTANQSLDLARFRGLMEQVRAIAAALGRARCEPLTSAPKRRAGTSGGSLPYAVPTPKECRGQLSLQYVAKVEQRRTARLPSRRVVRVKAFDIPDRFRSGFSQQRRCESPGDVVSVPWTRWF